MTCPFSSFGLGIDQFKIDLPPLDAPVITVDVRSRPLLLSGRFPQQTSQSTKTFDCIVFREHLGKLLVVICRYGFPELFRDFLRFAGATCCSLDKRKRYYSFNGIHLCLIPRSTLPLKNSRLPTFISNRYE